MEIHTNLNATGDELVGAIGFKVSEVKFFLAILKGIYNVIKADFIQNAINDLEEHLKPKQLPMINYFHFCALCTCEIDERVGNNFFHYIVEENKEKKIEAVDEWRHYTCPTLKENRPQ